MCVFFECVFREVHDKKRHTFQESTFCKLDFANTTLSKKHGARVK